LPFSSRFIVVLSSCLHLGITNRPFYSGFPTKTLIVHLFSPIHSTCLANLILLDGSRNHTPLHYEMFSGLLTLPSSQVRLPYVLIFPDMSSFSKLKLRSGRNL
jgi:hypothetical protein